jgi:hypothetical protein
MNDEKRWPLRGIVDDGPNLQHVLAAFFQLKKEHDLAWNFFLTPKDLLALFSTTLEVAYAKDAYAKELNQLTGQISFYRVLR